MALCTRARSMCLRVVRSIAGKHDTDGGMWSVTISLTSASPCFALTEDRTTGCRIRRVVTWGTRRAGGLPAGKPGLVADTHDRCQRS
jgi:hypothetical protein